MEYCVFIQTNHKQYLGALVAEYSLKRNADVYPTHGLGPVAVMADINRGNGLVSLTSHATKAIGLHNHIVEKGGADHPNATLKINKGTVIGNTHTLSGDLTVKGTTQPITFDLVMNGSTGTAKVVIDRTKFGIRYGSGSFFDNLGDKAIYDDFELDITLNF